MRLSLNANLPINNDLGQLKTRLFDLFKQIAVQVNGISEGNAASFYNAATAAPTTGDWAVGDFIRNSAPSRRTLTIGWVCTTAGTPGTWTPVTIPYARGAITVTANYTLAEGDSLVMVSPVASATIVITIPAVAQWMIDQNLTWETKLIAAGTMTLTPASGTIEGTTSVTTSIIQTALTIRATSDGWKII